MDPNQPTGTQHPLSAIFQNKKVVIALVAFVVFGGIGLLLLASDKSSTPGNKKTVSNNSGDNTDTTISGRPEKGGPKTQLSPTGDEVLPEDIAIEFYRWYVNHPAPLKSGEYQTRRDITDKYKTIMNGYVRRGLSTDRDDVFNCGDTKANLPRNVVPKNAEFDAQRETALVRIHNASTGFDAFIIKMEKVENEWKVRDIWCAP